MDTKPNGSAPICLPAPQEQKPKKQEKGATFVEYILLVTLIAIAGITTLQIFGQTISGKFSDINATILATS
jgi:Flp pilus assembly pilin Flp